MIIDLSHTIKTDMPVYPDSDPLEITDLGLYDEYGVNVQKYTFDGHIGTHIDAPAHLFSNGHTTETMKISTFYGTARVIDCTSFESEKIIGMEIFEQLNFNDLPDFILLYTGWSKKWGSESNFKVFPVASEELINTLAEAKIKGIGIDTISLDSMDSHYLDNHKKILGSDKIIIENLNNLEKLIEKRFQFSCFPLKIFKGDGSPVRAVGIID